MDKNQIAAESEETGFSEVSKQQIETEDVKEAIRSIWETILEISPIADDDFFFKLGGHSIIAIELIAKINKYFDVYLSMGQFFKAQTINLLTDVILQELHKSQKHEEQTVVSLPEIEADPANLHEPFPLTEVQQAYWVGRNTQVGLGHISSHIYQEIEVSDLDTQRFERALQKLIAYQPMLRVIFLPDGTQQILKDVSPYHIRITDFRNQSKAVAETELADIRKTLSHQIFKGDEWPLFEIRISLIEPERIRLHVSADLLIADAFSFQIFYSQLAYFYNKPTNLLPPLEISYRDYITSYDTLNRAEDIERSKRYWLNKLDHLPDGPKLPLAKDPDVIKDTRFKRVTSTLNKQIWNQLIIQAKEKGLTKTGLLLAVFSEILALWSKDPHFLLNLTLFNRLPVHKQINHIIGDFISIALLEVDYREQASFLDRALVIQERLWNDMDYRFFSGIRVTGELMKRGKARGIVPIVFTSLIDLADEDNDYFSDFNRVFNIINDKETFENNITQTPQVWLDHQIMEKDGGLCLNFDFVEELFPTSVIEEMFNSYCEFLFMLAMNEGLWNTESPLQEARDRFTFQKRIHGIVESQNKGTAIKDNLLHDDFLIHASQHPDAVAVITSNQSITYGELRQSTDVIRNQLIDLKVQKNKLVAIIMNKGWEQVAAVIGILRSGAAYLPIDPSLPENRIKELIEIGDVSTVLTDTSIDLNFELPPRITRSITVNLEMCQQTVVEQPEKRVDSSDLCYVMFTSGSTGKPKGVMITHYNAVNTIGAINRKFNIAATDRTFGISALNFDLSVFDMFSPLSAGGAIVMPDNDKIRDPEHWWGLLNEHRVSVWQSVPAYMKMLTEFAREKQLPALRLALFGGDWLPLSLPDQIKKLNASTKVVNLGGTTETTIHSTIFAIDTIDPLWKSIPYGVPLDNQTAFIMNHHLELCPVGVEGEICIGGSGVAKGYWKDEEKTANSFINHPESGQKLYKTGDLGKLHADGTIEFLGRADLQVKVSGFRIELGEIQTALERMSLVDHAVVLAKGAKFENKRLAAYLILNQNALKQLKTDEILKTAALNDVTEHIKKNLAQSLPSYCIPGPIMIMEKFPLTGNGKTDRKALAKIDDHSQKQTGNTGRLKSKFESGLLTIWQEILQIKNIGVNDSFFDLGGDSHKVIQVFNQMQNLWNLNIPIMDLFRFPTIALLAENISNQGVEHKFQESSTKRAQKILSARKNLRKNVKRKL